MKNFNVLMSTEWKEALKELKLVWLSLFFIILGLTQPLINRYMDIILKNVGGADGITLDPNRPDPTSGEVLLSTFSGQFNQMGLIVLVISLMGIIMTDKNNGIQDFILTRPVSVSSYILSKLISHWMISLVCIIFGGIISYYYTVYLFGPFSLTKFVMFILLYSIWILYVISLIIILSLFLKSSVTVAVITILIGMILIVLKDLNSTLSMILPSGILKYAESFLVSSDNTSALQIISCLIFTALNIYISHLKIKR